MDFVQILFEKGGVVMYPLLFLSVSGTFLIFRGFYIYRREYIFPKKYRLKWQNYSHNKNNTASDPLPEKHSHGDGILLSLLQNQKSSVDANDTADEMLKLRFKLENCLELLENVANVAPLFGLSGTVLGIIRIFQGRATDSVNALMISQGISEALFTTITGLFIAIPCIIFHNIIRRQLNTALIKVDEDIQETLKNLSIFN